MRFWLIAAAIAASSAAAAADQVTPSGSAGSIPTIKQSPAPRIQFAEAAQQLTAVFPIAINDYSQVVQHSYNWQGPADASLTCDIGFTVDAIVIKGEIADDVPFFQPRLHPAMPGWWKITYGADGIEFIMDDPTSPGLRLDMVLNFGSQATHPQVEVLTAPGKVAGILQNADFGVAASPNAAADNPRAQFNVAIPFAGIAEPKFFSGRLRITARLHDMDGDPATYLMMQEIIEKK